MAKKETKSLMDTKVINSLNILQDVGVIIFGLGSVALVTWFVLCRYIFKTNFRAFDELVSVAIFWFYYLGGSKASYDRVHIQADVVDIIKNKRLVSILKIIGSVISLIVLAYLIYLAFDFAKWNLLAKTKTIVLKFPLCISQFSIFVGCCLMFLFDLIHLIDDIKALRNTGEPVQTDN